jgi:hypothetical protein
MSQQEKETTLMKQFCATGSVADKKMGVRAQVLIFTITRARKVCDEYHRSKTKTNHKTRIMDVFCMSSTIM